MRPLALLLVLIAADQRYGYTQDQLNDAAFYSVTNSEIALPPITSELKALAPAARASAITTLGKAVRAFVESAAFKTRYQEYVTSVRPPKPAPKKSVEAVYAEKKKEVDAQRGEIEKSLAGLDPAQRAQLKAGIEQGLKATLDMYKDKATVDGLEQQRFDQEQARFDASVRDYPDDFKVALKAKLTKFLAQTADVDYSAKTATQYNQQRFVNEAYETKPQDWKRAYRAGKPATDAARTFATAWLNAL